MINVQPIEEDVPQGPGDQDQSTDHGVIEHDLAFAAKYIEGLLLNHNGSLARIAKVREARYFYMTKVNELDQQLRQMIKDLEKELLGNRQSNENMNLSFLESNFQDSMITYYQPKE